MKSINWKFLVISSLLLSVAVLGTTVAEISEWSAMNEVCVEHFPAKPPARSALGAKGLALGTRTEIECIATVSSSK